MTFPLKEFERRTAEAARELGCDDDHDCGLNDVREALKIVALMWDAMVSVNPSEPRAAIHDAEEQIKELLK